MRCWASDVEMISEYRFALAMAVNTVTWLATCSYQAREDRGLAKRFLTLFIILRDGLKTVWFAFIQDLAYNWARGGVKIYGYILPR